MGSIGKNRRQIHDDVELCMREATNSSKPLGLAVYQ